MPTPSKAHRAIMSIHECAKIAMATGIDYPFAEGEAVIAYRALNALAEAIRGGVPVKGQARRKVEAPMQEGGE